MNKLLSIRDGFGQGMLDIAKDTRIYALCADLTESLRLNTFKAKYPERFLEMGVAEQNMIGVAAGLALIGKIPFAASFACFSPGRTFDQIRVSVCYQDANVKIIGGHAGISVGEDGATHQMLEDIAMMRALPNMTVLVPADYDQARMMVKSMSDHPGPVYLRLSRTGGKKVTTEQFQIGKSTILRAGKDLTIVACGLMVEKALAAAEILAKENIELEVINAASIKPFDQETLLTSVHKTKRVVTMEEHQIAGGLGSVVAEVLAKELPTQQCFIGIEDQFGQSGTVDELFDYYQLSTDHIVRKIQHFMHY